MVLSTSSNGLCCSWNIWINGIVGTFFVKDYLNLSAAFLAGLGFWAGIPWALKMPLGHMVDLIWTRKKLYGFFWSWSHRTQFIYYVWIDCSYRRDELIFKS